LEKFKKGWGCKGLLYGGNLSNGGALLVSNFGPWPKAGDVVGVYLQIDEQTIKVSFDINGRALGCGFGVPRTTLGNVYPIMHFSEDGGKAIITKSDEIPPTTRVEETFQGIFGHWEYVSGSFATHGSTPTLDIRQDGDSINGSLRVVNTIRIAIKPKSEGGWTGQPGMTTLMGGEPEMMQLENDMTALFSGTITLDEANNLTVTSGNNSSVWNRYVPAKGTVTKNPFQ